MERRQALSSLIALASLAWTARVDAADEIGVIVHGKRFNRALTPHELHAIFTTRLKLLDGRRVIPFNLPPRTRGRVDFDKAVLGMDPDEVARHWIDRRVRGGAPPPKQVPTAKVMLAVVAKLENAIGYLPESLVDDRVQIVARVINGKVHGPR
jgi:hypothetical protein